VTEILLEHGVIGLAKEMTVDGTGPYSVTIDFFFENFGDVLLSNLSVLGAGLVTFCTFENGRILRGLGCGSIRRDKNNACKQDQFVRRSGSGLNR